MSAVTVPTASAWDRVRTYRPPQRYLPIIATAALFVGLFGVGGMRYDGLTDPQVLLSLLIDNAFLIVLGVGMTFVILTGGIDLSVGSVVALSTMIAAKTLDMGWSPYLSMVTVLATGTLLGLLMGLLVGALARTGASENWRLLLGVGLLGGFTTFSAFALDAATMIERGAALGALGYALVSVVGAIAAVFAGLALVRVAA